MDIEMAFADDMEIMKYVEEVVKFIVKEVIDKNKIEQCISELRKIGWFSNVVLDKILLEVKNE